MSAESNERSKKVVAEESVEISKRSRSQDSSVSEDASAHTKKPKLTGETVEEVKEQDEGSEINLPKANQSGNSSVPDDESEGEGSDATSTQAEEKETKDSEKDDIALNTDGETKQSDSAGKLKFGESSTYSSGFSIASKPFGSSTVFGSGFGILKKNKDNDNQTDERVTSTSNEVKKPLSFGSGLAFGSGFNVLKQENSNNDSASGKDPNQKEFGDISSRQVSEETDDANTSTTSLKLTKQVIQSGEEAENSVYQANAKLYQLTDIKEGWKERGIGPVHVNEDKNKSKARLVMRSRGLLKVILNLPLVKGFSIQKGFPGSLQGEKFVRLLAIDEKGNPVQYALKTAKAEVADELFTTVKKLISEK